MQASVANPRRGTFGKHQNMVEITIPCRSMAVSRRETYKADSEEEGSWEYID